MVLINSLLFLLIGWHIALSHGVQIVRQNPPATGNNAVMFRHNAYIDAKLRQFPINMLNHGSWYGRKLVQSSKPAPAKSVLHDIPFLFNASVTRLTSQGVLPTRSSVASSTGTGISMGAFKSNFFGTKGITHLKSEEVSTISHSWDEITNNACLLRMNSLNGTATNPSGKAVCHNIQDLNNSTGAFTADVRLFQVAPATGNWLSLRPTGLTIGMSYHAASVQLQNTEGEGGKSGESWLSRDRAHSQLRRSLGQEPQFLQKMVFLGQVKSDSVAKLKDKLHTFELIQPKINLAGLLDDGTPIRTQLALTDASFVSGLFTDPAFNQFAGSMSDLALQIDSPAWLRNANTFAEFPIQLIVTGFWSIALLLLTAFETLGRLKVRQDDKRRMRRGLKDGWSIAQDKE